LNSLRQVADVFVTEDEQESSLLNAIEGAIVLMITYGRVTRRVIKAGEPLQKEGHPLSELIMMDNVVITPHLAAWIHETWDQLQKEVLQHVMDILEGRDSIIYSSDPRLQNQSHCIYPTA